MSPVKMVTEDVTAEQVDTLIVVVHHPNLVFHKSSIFSQIPWICPLQVLLMIKFVQEAAAKAERKRLKKLAKAKAALAEVASANTWLQALRPKPMLARFVGRLSKSTSTAEPVGSN